MSSIDIYHKTAAIKNNVNNSHQQPNQRAGNGTSDSMKNRRKNTAVYLHT